MDYIIISQAEAQNKRCYILKPHPIDSIMSYRMDGFIKNDGKSVMIKTVLMNQNRRNKFRELLDIYELSNIDTEIYGLVEQTLNVVIDNIMSFENVTELSNYLSIDNISDVNEIFEKISVSRW